MADFLLVHDAGQGSWCWGKVWGHLTAPEEHPPRLYRKSKAGKVVAVDLPGHGHQGDHDPRHILAAPFQLGGTGATLEDCASAVAGLVQSHGLHDLIIAAHGMAAPVVLKAAQMLDEPPKRIVLFAGLIPAEGKTPLDMLPRLHRQGFKMMSRLNGISRREFRLPKAVITQVYCNGMDPFDVIQIVGRFSSLPLPLFNTRTRIGDLAPNCPVSYVPLWRDRLIPPHLQRSMAARLAGAELGRELDSCHEVMIERPKQVADILAGYA